MPLDGDKTNYNIKKDNEVAIRSTYRAHSHSALRSTCEGIAILKFSCLKNLQFTRDLDFSKRQINRVWEPPGNMVLRCGYNQIF